MIFQLNKALILHYNHNLYLAAVKSVSDSLSKKNFYISNISLDKLNHCLAVENPELIIVYKDFLDSILELVKLNNLTSTIISIINNREYELLISNLSGTIYYLKNDNYSLIPSLLNFILDNYFVQRNTVLFQPRLSKSSQKKFLVKHGKKFVPLKTKLIAYFFSSNGVSIKTFKNEIYHINLSFAELSNRLQQNKFIRLNENIICNIEAIVNIYSNDNGHYVTLSPDHSEKPILSRERFNYIKNYFSE